jgi:hypothetical protein
MLMMSCEQASDTGAQFGALVPVCRLLPGALGGRAGQRGESQRAASAAGGAGARETHVPGVLERHSIGACTGFVVVFVVLRSMPAEQASVWVCGMCMCSC